MIQLSSLVGAMLSSDKPSAVLMRYVYDNDSSPRMCVGRAVSERDEEGRTSAQYIEFVCVR